MIIQEDRERQQMRSDFFSDYGRGKLMNYADSFRELASSFTGSFVSSDKDSEDREGQLAGHRIWENRQVLGENLMEVSRVMTRIASEVFRYRPFPEKQKNKLKSALRLEKIILADLFYIENRTGHYSFCAVLSTEKKGGYASADVADMLSVLLNRRLQVTGTSPCMVDQQNHPFLFVEEPAFVILPGFAKAVKENEEVSGDNYAILEEDNGRVTVMLSDGMGSGVKASEDSEKVLDLMEKLVEAGYEPAAAVKLVNSVLVAAGEEGNMSTLDLCTIDRYTGMCEFRKCGAAATFLKSNAYVEQISAWSLPLGILQTMEEAPVSRELIDNDYIILMTDGVLDALQAGGYEDMMCHYIEDMTELNPGEIARKLLRLALQCSGGHVADDMTVLVLGIFHS